MKSLKHRIALRIAVPVLALSCIAAMAWSGLSSGMAHAQQGSGGDVNERLRKRSQALEAADAEVRAAQGALEAARQRLTDGEEPLPGERSGIANGKSRLNDAYFRRQAALKQDVQKAEQRLERALARRNALR